MLSFPQSILKAAYAVSLPGMSTIRKQEEGFSTKGPLIEGSINNEQANISEIPILLNLEQEITENNQQLGNNGESEQYSMQEVGNIIAKIATHLEVNENIDDESYPNKKTEEYDEALTAIKLHINSQETLQSTKQRFKRFSDLRNKLNPIDIHLLAQNDWYSNLIPSAMEQINKQAKNLNANDFDQIHSQTITIHIGEELTKYFHSWHLFA